MTALRERYIVDETGKKVQVVLDIEVFRELLEELEMQDDIRAYDEAMAAPTEAIPFEQAIAEIEKRREHCA